MEHLIISESNSSDTTDLLLNEWMLLAHNNNKLHDAAARYYKIRADTCMICAIVLGSSSGILNIALGSMALPVLVNVAHIYLGAIGIFSTGIDLGNLNLKPTLFNTSSTR